MIFLKCNLCGADVGRTASAELIDKMYALHDLRCPNRVPAVPTPEGGPEQ